MLSSNLGMTQPSEWTVIDWKSVKINGTVKLGDSEAVFQSNLGVPNVIADELDDHLGQMMRILTYGQSEFVFIQGRLESFEIKDSTFLISIGSHSIRVGMSAQTALSPFQTSWNNRKFDHHTSQFYSTMTYGAVVNGVLTPVDEWLEVAWNSNGVIVEIMHVIPS